jgi:hypothetical protein
MSESIESTASTTPFRAVLGAIGGALVWMFGFLVLARILVALWPDYGVPARLWTRGGVYTFTSLMSVFNLGFWIMAEIAAGWITSVIGRSSRAVWVLAVLVMAYLCVMHFYVVWSKIPWWYNLIVALSSGPAVLLGGRLGASRSNAPSGVLAV